LSNKQSSIISRHSGIITENSSRPSDNAIRLVD